MRINKSQHCPVTAGEGEEGKTKRRILSSTPVFFPILVRPSHPPPCSQSPLSSPQSGPLTILPAAKSPLLPPVKPSHSQSITFISNAVISRSAQTDISAVILTTLPCQLPGPGLCLTVMRRGDRSRKAAAAARSTVEIGAASECCHRKASSRSRTENINRRRRTEAEAGAGAGEDRTIDGQMAAGCESLTSSLTHWRDSVLMRTLLGLSKLGQL